MARIHQNVKAQQRYEMTPVIDPATGEQAVISIFKGNTGEPKRDRRGKPITRLHTRADKSRPLPPHVCGHCRKPIEPGTRYKHVSIKSGPYGGRTLRRHQDCPTWRQSELTTSKMAGVYAAQEGFDDFLAGAFEDADEVREALAQAAEDIRAVAEEYRESAENIREGFGHDTWQSEELDGKADELEGWADEIENDDVEDPPEADDDDEPLDDDALEQWREDVRQSISTVNDCPV
jgi:hypothetical protein